MADISQSLGFDASQAISTLQQLDSQLRAFQKSITSTGRSLATFNKNAVGLVATLGNLGPQSVGRTAQAFSTVTSNANSSATALRNFGNAANANLNKASAGAERLTVSFGTLVRVVNTQLIVRAMSSIRNAFEDSVQSAIGFQTQLAQIQTIGKEQVGTLDEVSQKVRRLSETFGQPVEDVAAGFYEILSNQIGNASEATVVLTESLKLSKAAVSTTADAANALSSIINSYGLAASDAADISGKLFAAVDKGRFVLSEIANTIGRVTTVGAELGVSLDEVLASLSVLTINGVKADEAMTLLGNGMRSLLKPTEAMKAAFAELGVTSGEIGVATFGFQGFLEKLRDTTAGTASEVTQLTENIRVGRAVFGLTGKAAEQYAENLEAIRAAGATQADDAFNLIINTNAQQVTRELTALRNFFVVDFGQNALKVGKQLFDTFGGLVNLFKSFGQATTFVLAAVVTFKTMNAVINATQTAIKATTTQTTILNGKLVQTKQATLSLGQSIKTALNSTVVLAAITAITTGITALAKSQSEAGKKFRSFANDVASLVGIQLFDEAALQAEQNALAVANSLDTFAAAEQERARIATISAKKIQQIRSDEIKVAFAEQFKLVAQIEKAYQEDVRNASTAQREISDNLKDQLKLRLGVLEDLINELQNKQRDAERTITRNSEETNDIILKNDERVFDRRLKLIDEGVLAANEAERKFAQLNRSRALQAQAAATINKSSVTKEEFDAADDLLKNAESRAAAALEEADTRIKEARTQSDRFDALQGARQVENEINKIVGQRIALRNQENAQAKAVADAAQRDLLNRRTQLADAKKLVDQINKLKVISRDSEVGLGTREEAFKQIDPLVDELQTVLSRGDLSLEQFLGVQDFAQELRGDFQSALNGQPLSLKGAFTEGINEVFNTLEARTIQLKAEIEIVEKASGKKFSLDKGTEDISLGLTERRESQLQGLADQAGLPDLESQLRVAQKQLESLAKLTLSKKLDGGRFVAGDDLKREISGLGEAASAAIQGDTAALISAQQTLQAATNRASEKGLTEATNLLAGLLKQTTELLVQAQTANATRAAALPLAVANAGSTQAATDLAKKRFETNVGEAIRLTKILDTELQRTGQGRAEEVFFGIDDSLEGVAKGADDAAKKVAELRKQLLALGVAKSVVVPQTPTAQHFGGLIKGFKAGGIARHFASGGIAQGTDNIPALLSSGETVVDSRNSRKFFSELQAIRAGNSPSSEPATSVTNNTIGDINVHGAGQPDVVARKVMDLIRRELRRGSGRIQ
jgi:TP901 family phage tail tape measure protein